MLASPQQPILLISVRSNGMPNEPKYITVNGVMKKNPKYVAENTRSAVSASTSDTTNLPLAVVSSPSDIEIAQQIQEHFNKYSVPMASSTESSMDLLQDQEMLQKFQYSTPPSNDSILDKLGEIFSKYDTPFGLINKLLMLTEYKLDFIIDDSGSMINNYTDVDALEASEPTRTAIKNRLGRIPSPGEKMNRIEEAEDRLHILIDILAYIPIDHIQIRFLNSPTVLVLDRRNKTPEQYQAYAHQAIRTQFSMLNFKGTPVSNALKIGFDYPGKWSHYLFNDGEPNEGGKAIAYQIKNRNNPQLHPLTLISCTNNDKDTEWMKHVDADASFVAEVDDYYDERDEVVKNQGAGFPYSRGVWFLCNLTAAINPFDLDCLDEDLPFTKFALENILGRKLNPNEYQYYFERNPNSVLYVAEYSRFLTEECFSRHIISEAEQNRREGTAGYINGERPRGRPLANITPQIAEITYGAMQQFAAQYSADVNNVTTQMSSVTIAPNSSFMPPQNNNNNMNQQQHYKSGFNY
jgi:hypothetical protein